MCVLQLSMTPQEQPQRLEQPSSILKAPCTKFHMTTELSAVPEIDCSLCAHAGKKLETRLDCVQILMTAAIMISWSWLLQ